MDSTKAFTSPRSTTEEGETTEAGFIESAKDDRMLFIQEQGAVEIVESSPPQEEKPFVRFHGEELRGLMDVPHSPLYQGRFGRMFRKLPALQSSIADLNALAGTMVATPGRGIDNPDIPSGFTYLGQFIDHDLTFDPTSKLQRDNDPDALVNFRTPRFDLDSIYGSGPIDSPYLYQSDGVRMRIGKTVDDEDDLPRTESFEPGDKLRPALIGDPRNDENIIVSQLHLAFLKYHNRVVDELQTQGVTGRETLFNEARRIVRWHYQWIVIHDFLRRVVGNEVVDDILKMDIYVVHRTNGASPSGTRVAYPKVFLKFFDWRNNPHIPVEFSGAAYRFGHSMVRGAYVLNSQTPIIPIFVENFQSEFSDLRGFRERPSFWEIAWERFFEFPEGESPIQPSLKIDSKLASGLAFLPFAPDLPSLPARNLQRGQALGLPSGQAVARAMSIPEDLILKGLQLGLSPILEARFGQNTPLWYYILREAEGLADGRKLGPIGGRIVAEVLLGLLHGDPFSYLTIAPGWTPSRNKFGADGVGNFTMVHLLRFAGMKIKG